MGRYGPECGNRTNNRQQTSAKIAIDIIKPLCENINTENKVGNEPAKQPAK